MSSCSRPRRSSSHSTNSSQDKRTRIARPSHYLSRSISCSDSHHSKDSKRYHKNRDRGRNLSRDHRRLGRRSNSHSRKSRSQSSSTTQSYSKSQSSRDQSRGYYHRRCRSRSHSPSQRGYRSSRSRSRGSHYSIAGRYSSRSYHRRNKYWSRSRSYSRDRDRYYSRMSGVYHPPYPPYNARIHPPHPIALMHMHAGTFNPDFRGYSNTNLHYGSGCVGQYGGTGSYHSHHGDLIPRGPIIHGYYGGSRSRDKGPPQLHKRRNDGPPGVSLLIRHISPAISTQNLFQIFTKKLPHLPPPRDIYIPRDFHSHQPKGFAFVEYTSFDQAQEARCEMDKSIIHGREIEVVFAQDKRKTPSQMRDRHLDDAYGGGIVSKSIRGHDSSSSFEKHKKKERQKERRRRCDDDHDDEKDKVSSSLRQK